MSDERREVLESLLASPGWQLFQQHVGDDWGPKAYAQRLKSAVSQARQVGKDAAQAIELVDAANDAIADAMRWPGEEIMRLKRIEPETDAVTMSRRGGL